MWNVLWKVYMYWLILFTVVIFIVHQFFGSYHIHKAQHVRRLNLLTEIETWDGELKEEKETNSSSY